MAGISLPALAVLAAVHLQWLLNPKTVTARAQELPAQAQVIDQRSFNGTPPPLLLATPLGARLVLVSDMAQFGPQRYRRPPSPTAPRFSCPPASLQKSS